jgi:hypothetical protein
MRVPTDRRGATLVLVLFSIVLMSVLIASAFARTSGERRVNADHLAQVEAFGVAQTGLERYLSAVTEEPGLVSDTTLASLPGGFADVGVWRLRDSAGGIPAMYLVVSRGVSTTAKRYDARAPAAERIVAQYAVWRPMTLDLDAAFTSLSGLDKNGSSGRLSGVDNCGAKPAVPGVAVPNGLYSGPTGPIDGNPDNAPIYLGTAGTGGTAKDAVRIDWAAIRDSNAIAADYTIPGSSWPTSTEMLDWPVIRVNGDHSVNGGATDGKGVLIVTGNLTLGGSWKHEGLVLVGGTLTSNGNNTITGAVVTGLNVKVGTAVAQTAIGNGNKTFQYDSCDIAEALDRLASFHRIPNAWVDNLPGY